MAVYSPVLLPSSHALLIHRSIQLSLHWEDDLMVNDNGLNDLIDMRLTGHRVLVVWYGHQGGAKADSQVVGVHHVLVTVLGQTRETKAVSVTNSALNTWNGATGLTDLEMQTGIS